MLKMINLEAKMLKLETEMVILKIIICSKQPLLIGPLKMCVTLLYPCSSNHLLSTRLVYVCGIERMKFKREMLSIASINTLNGRWFFDFSLSFDNRLRISGLSRIIACVFLYTVSWVDLHSTKMNSTLGGKITVSLKLVHGDNLDSKWILV